MCARHLANAAVRRGNSAVRYDTSRSCKAQKRIRLSKKFSQCFSLCGLPGALSQGQSELQRNNGDPCNESVPPSSQRDDIVVTKWHEVISHPPRYHSHGDDDRTGAGLQKRRHKDSRREQVVTDGMAKHRPYRWSELADWGSNGSRSLCERRTRSGAFRNSQ